MTLGMQDTLHALADPTRREILNLLKQSRLSAGRIFIQSLCSVWPASDSAGSSFSMCGRNKH